MPVPPSLASRDEWPAPGSEGVFRAGRQLDAARLPRVLAFLRRGAGGGTVRRNVRRLVARGRGSGRTAASRASGSGPPALLLCKPVASRACAYCASNRQGSRRTCTPQKEPPQTLHHRALRSIGKRIGDAPTWMRPSTSHGERRSSSSTSPRGFVESCRHLFHDKAPVTWESTADSFCCRGGTAKPTLSSRRCSPAAPQLAGLSRRPAPDFCFRLQSHTSRAPLFPAHQQATRANAVSDRPVPSLPKFGSPIPAPVACSLRTDTCTLHRCRTDRVPSGLAFGARQCRQLGHHGSCCGGPNRSREGRLLGIILRGRARKDGDWHATATVGKGLIGRT